MEKMYRYPGKGTEIIKLWEWACERGRERVTLPAFINSSWIHLNAEFKNDIWITSLSSTPFFINLTTGFCLMLSTHLLFPSFILSPPLSPSPSISITSTYGYNCQNLLLLLLTANSQHCSLKELFNSLQKCPLKTKFIWENRISMGTHNWICFTPCSNFPFFKSLTSMKGWVEKTFPRERELGKLVVLDFQKMTVSEETCVIMIGDVSGVVYRSIPVNEMNEVRDR